MKLMGTCETCHRELLLDQVFEPDTAGRCPWCGAGMGHNYLILLHRLIPEAERAGRELARALDLLNGNWTGFELNERSVLGPIERSLATEASERAPAMSARRRPAPIPEPQPV